MKYEVQRTSQFKKDVKLLVKRGMDIKILKETIKMLMDGQTLPESCKDHFLSGNWSGYKECHIKPDWLLVYDIDENVITLYRTGSHSDIF